MQIKLWLYGSFIVPVAFLLLQDIDTEIGRRATNFDIPKKGLYRIAGVTYLERVTNQDLQE